MRILAFDLSSATGSIAWFDKNAEPTERAFANDRKHSGNFFDALQALLRQFGNPELIVVGLGPGSYAGTRIAIATATGLQAATGARLLGISSLRAIATDAESYCVIGDARRESFFFARIVGRDAVEGPLLYTRDELAERLHGEVDPVFASEKISHLPRVELAHPSARVLAEIAAKSPSTFAAAPLEPIYLRDPHITQPNRATMLQANR
jgi:tRNA threonylcarbamoyladenosine biosynthesis protein TsaB